MSIKLIGAIMIIATCTMVSISMSTAYIRQEKQLEELIQALLYIKCELQYRLTPLSQQFQQCSSLTSGAVSKFFDVLQGELEAQINPDAGCCLNAALQKTSDLAPLAVQALSRFGQTLGCFDVDGQLTGLEDALCFCQEHFEILKKDHPIKIRNYHTLGLCAGAALAVLFI